MRLPIAVLGSILCVLALSGIAYGQDEEPPTPPPAGETDGEPPTAPPAGETYEIFLTFDDGPVYGSDDVLNNLKDEGVKATFFVNGFNLDKDRWGKKRYEQHLSFLKRMVAEGHLVANHSYSHEYKYGDSDWMKQDFSKNVDTVKGELGGDYDANFEKFARLPGSNAWRSGDAQNPIDKDTTTRGNSTKDTADKLKDAGYAVIGWDAEWQQKGDWDLKQTVAEMATEIIDKLQNNRTKKPKKLVLLTHDRLFRSSKNNGTKVSELIKELKGRGNVVFKRIDQY